MPPSVPTRQDGLGDRARLLIIDDEPAMLKLLTRILAPCYAVELASGGRMALRMLDALPPFDVVLCDLHLPDIEGSDVYEAVCARRPEMRARFLFMTGERASAVPGFGDASTRVHVLLKPFDAGTLSAAIEATLCRLSSDAGR